ncbi:hypothetical protein M0638_27345 [Roseomonas sp. NAR14]|uniref:Uncharacterized protein n=1 Tax=Roseomonas acroporae TaxID=2937791 RepID=A0A9X1YDC9_9PROT|nr:hypothetical protein [Roseomonas acroporae]MCK8788076.1 hypothetical protein [Roseomonas acroporae]
MTDDAVPEQPETEPPMPDNPASPVPPPLSAAEAEILAVEAANKRATIAASAGADPLWLAQLAAEAAGLEAAAAVLQRGHDALAVGNGGEVAVPISPDDRWPDRMVSMAVRDAPAALDAEASRSRLQLAHQVGVLAEAVQAGAEADTPLQKGLAHMLTAVHRLTMELSAAAVRDMARDRSAGHLHPKALAEAAKTANVVGRLTEAYARGLHTLDRVKNGGRQEVVVRHVHTHVAEGGQAVVIAGDVQQGRGASGR